jgi:putative acetyltransferase
VPQSITTELSSPSSPEAQPLLDSLSGELQRRFGSDGRARFAEWREHDQRYVFVLARQDGQPAGCGAVRPIHPRHGVGSAVLRRLVEEAREAGYGSLWLQTRWANTAAVEFYRSHGFTERENYGHYVGRSQCACFERRLF